jgi:hypothetical protein
MRSKKYLAAANGESCVNCGVRDGTVVAAHYTGLRQQQYGKGTGVKADDLFTASLCAACHSAFDQMKMSQLKDSYLRKIDQSERFQHCVLMTIKRRIEQGVLKVN